GVDEVSAIELRAMVNARRADLAAQRAGVNLAPRPPVWAATWFEAIATTSRIAIDEPVLRFKMDNAILQQARPERYVDGQWRSAQAEIRGRGFAYSSEFCPRCHADTDGGWNGKVCKGRALIKGKPDMGVLESGKEPTEQQLDGTAPAVWKRRPFRCGYV